MSLVFNPQMKSWLMMNDWCNSKFCKYLHRDHPSVTAILFRGQWLIPNFFLFALHIGQLFLCFALACTHPFWLLIQVLSLWKSCRFETNSSPKMKKFRQNFFESIQSDWAKKMKVLPNSFWGDFRKKYVFQTSKQKRFPFFGGNSNLFKTPTI